MNSFQPLCASPTLTNPDMVLPNEIDHVTALPSPPRNQWRVGTPPSPSFLLDNSDASQTEDRRPSTSSTTVAKRKQKLGLMSRKMMLLRSRTASSNAGLTLAADKHSESSAQNISSSDSGSDGNFGQESSPALMDVGNLAPEQKRQQRESTGSSSVGSEEMVTLKQFLRRYEANGSSSKEEGLEEPSAVLQAFWHTQSRAADNATSSKQTDGWRSQREEGSRGIDEEQTRQDEEMSMPAEVRSQRGSVVTDITADDDAEHRRMQQDEEEYKSAVLSQRAEEILANAKKRLNLMEGNLRGARDLVAPLTADNLRRATSVASQYPASRNPYASRDFHLFQDLHGARTPPRADRTLHAQASSPTMGRDYQGHGRGFSETQLSGRPSTAMDRTVSPIIANGRIPTKANDPGWTQTLKGSRSDVALGSSYSKQTASRDQLYSNSSPNAGLGILVEDDGSTHDISARRISSGMNSRDVLEASRPPSRSEDLREQMSTLRSRISSLRERARHDSLCRRSEQNLQQPSPLNNAASNSPELLYASSPTYGSPVLDDRASVSVSSPRRDVGATLIRGYGQDPDQSPIISGNAFAEQVERQQQQQQQQGFGNLTPEQQDQLDEPRAAQHTPSGHRRTPSGTAVVEASKHRYSHHQQHKSTDAVDAYGQNKHSGYYQDRNEIGVAHDGSSLYEDGESSEAGASIYEDAPTEQQGPVVLAHEDREDAFDYETFFLHSAAATYANRRGSNSSEGSIDSVETARGPAVPPTSDGYDEYGDNLEAEDEDFLPPTPETPEKLREIERTLGRRNRSRSLSEESVSTLATFATATEGRSTPENGSREPSRATDWPIRSPEPGLSSVSRPRTAIPVKRPPARSETSSGADSGISLSRRPHSSQDSKRPSNFLHSRSPLSPPMSPSRHSPALHDPATTIVDSLLHSPGARRQLGLKDRALLFGLVENLRKVCRGLQEMEEGCYEGRALRRRLDGARRELEGEF